MAYLFEPPTRRAFFRSAAAAAVAASRLGAADKTARWALLSDTHSPADHADSYRGFQPFANLKQVVGQVLESGAGSAYINGDLARQQGTEGEYQAFIELVTPLAQRIPLALGLGNHDDRAQFLKVVRTNLKVAGDQQPVKRKVVTVVDSGPVRLVFLDSQFIDGQVPGLLGKAQREWLDQFLGNGGAPTLLFVHHTLGDDDGGLLDAERLLRIAGSRRNVKAVFYGHSHRYQCDVEGGLHLINLPAVGYNFTDDQPVGWVSAEFSLTGCDLTLHAIAGNREANGKTRSLSWRT